MEELKVDLLNEKKTLSEDYEKLKKNYLNQIATINNKITSQEASFDKEKGIHFKEFSKLKDSFDKLKKEYEVCIQNNKTLVDTIK